MATKITQNQSVVPKKILLYETATKLHLDS